ncbi:hypothetical protein V1294_005377 [Bradyrhizobium sp. AZCC 1678]|uniref:hypothetical protein n=1 Tax=Bradyrhizobium sp. AZCC 1678 TaxID=3117030 RepID=UPI002FF38D64
MSSLAKRTISGADNGRSLQAEEDASALAQILKDLVPQAGAALDNETLQSIIGSALNIYVQRFEEGDRSAVVPPDAGLNATAVLIVASMLLKSARVELFELGMFQTFSGIK